MYLDLSRSSKCSRFLLDVVKIFVLACTSVNVSNLLVNPGAETGFLSPWAIVGTSAPGIDNGTFDPNIKPHSGGYQFGRFSVQTVALTQNVVISGTQSITPALIDSCNLVAHISFWEQGLNQGANNDDAQVILAFLDVNNVLLQNISTPEVDFSAGVWGQYSNAYTIPVGTRSINYTMKFIRHTGTDLDAFMDDNVLTIVKQ
ncbi:unnamed protein product [Didymodactylos carnosus]|uniref:Uncharacterized protein n=1 Tax=Didymodactylos carnosus TaxID=1234261 RepID=A0A815KHB9_9BILA|nr:unnamed protein product [Didymodactylos carnosus]CAF4290194.1 unnamed protein product [Didymodactylos carnosus]